MAHFLLAVHPTSVLSAPAAAVVNPGMSASLAG